jgi:hypothetical protein
MEAKSNSGHGRFLFLLRLTLLAGAAYDLAFAALMVLAPELPEKLLRLPPPGEDFYLWLLAVFLCMLAGVYLLAAYDPTNYRGNIVIAILGRLAGGMVFLLAATGRTDLNGLYIIAGGDFLFSFLTAVFWWPIRKPGYYRTQGGH